MYQRNTEIREARGKIPFWLIAERLGVHENTLRGWMRKELSPERKVQVLNAIQWIEKEYVKEN